jgi:anti-sigma B factor antagonist
MLGTDRTFHVEVVSVVRVAGEIDVASAPELEKWLDTLPLGGQDVVVDLSSVTFMDSTGLGLLVGAWNRCNNSEPQSRLSLVVATPEIERLLEVAGLSDIFDRFPSLAEAAGR